MKFKPSLRVLQTLPSFAMPSRANAAAGKKDKKKEKVDSAKGSKTRGTATEPYLVCISGKVPLALILLVVMLHWNVGFLHAS